jgi:Flp pilus assembly protein TadG
VLDRRGVTAIVFAVSATALLGVVGLATEVGAWYLGRIQAYNVADAAALAGALAAAAPQGSAAATFNVDGDQTVLQFKSSFPNATVAVVASSSNNPTATTIQIRIPFIPLLASLFTNDPTVTVAATAEAVVQPVNTACALSLGNLTITQNQASYGGIDGFGCYYASNATNSAAVTFVNGASIIAGGVTTPGDCSGCPEVAFDPPQQSVLTGGIDTTGESFMYRPNSSYQLPTTVENLSTGGASGAGHLLGNLSYPSIDILTLPSTLVASSGSPGIRCPTGLTYSPPGTDPVSHCPTAPGGATVTLSTSLLVPTLGDATLQSAPNPNPTCPLTAAQRANGEYCAYYNMNVIVPNGATVTLSPPDGTNTVADATYLFVNSSLTVQSGGTLQCIAGVSTTSYPGALPCAPGPQNLSGLSATPAGSIGATIVLTGNAVGILTFCGVATTTVCPGGGSGSNVYLSAPTNSGFSTLLNGIVLYRRGQSSGENATSPGVNIADPSGTVLLNGGMYFPRSVVIYEANTNPTSSYTPSCSILVAASLTLGVRDPADNQANPTQFADNGCASYGTPVPNVEAAQVIQ